MCAPVGLHIVDTVGDSEAVSVGPEVVVIDEHRLPIPIDSLILEDANELLLLGINADDRQVLGGAAFPQFGDSGVVSVSEIRTKAKN